MPRSAARARCTRDFMPEADKTQAHRRVGLADALDLDQLQRLALDFGQAPQHRAQAGRELAGSSCSGGSGGAGDSSAPGSIPPGRSRRTRALR